MKILALDYGIKNIGLAISSGQLAEPFGELENKDRQDLLKKLKRICFNNKVELIIIGLPQGKLQPIIKNFSQELEKTTKIKLVLHDETLTSQEAVIRMVEAGKKLKKRRREKHIISACLILQSYLDQRGLN